jgi:hypothetical protein
LKASLAIADSGRMTSKPEVTGLLPVCRQATRGLFDLVRHRRDVLLFQSAKPNRLSIDGLGLTMNK